MYEKVVGTFSRKLRRRTTRGLYSSLLILTTQPSSITYLPNRTFPCFTSPTFTGLKKQPPLLTHAHRYSFERSTSWFQDPYLQTVKRYQVDANSLLCCSYEKNTIDLQMKLVESRLDQAMPSEATKVNCGMQTQKQNLEKNCSPAVYEKRQPPEGGRRKLEDTLKGMK